jgi:transcriptional regulator with XRE-family HTH domain
VTSAEIGPRVGAARERLGWSREALAFHSGLSWSAIAQVESGRRTNMRPSTLVALSQALGVSVDYLIDGGLTHPPMLNHAAFPYRTEDQFRTTIAPFLAEGVARSEAVLALTTPANAELLREDLGKDARRVEFMNASTWYTTPIAALEAIKVFVEAKLHDGAHWVRFVGDPPWAGSDAEVRQWVRYEALFNLVFSAAPVSVICAYDERVVAPEIVRDAHFTHPHMVDDQGTSRSTGYSDPGRFALEP